MKWAMAFLALLATASAAVSQDELEPFPSAYFCVSAAPLEPEEVPRTAIEMLEYIERQLRTGRVLQFNGGSADFENYLPDFPYTVHARHNDVSILSRAYLMDGGPNCDAFRSEPYGQCDWSFREPTTRDESSKGVRLVWETLVLDRNQLTLTTIYSGEAENTVEVFDCTDGADVSLLMRPSP